MKILQKTEEEFKEKKEFLKKMDIGMIDDVFTDEWFKQAQIKAIKGVLEEVRQEIDGVSCSYLGCKACRYRQDIKISKILKELK